MFLVNQQAPKAGFLLKQEALLNTFENLCVDGLDSFYQGDIAKIHADYLAKNGRALSFNDFNEFDAEFVKPLKTKISKGELYNLPAPTQGISSLMFLALYDKIHIIKFNNFENMEFDDVDNIHSLVEITKRFF